MTVLFWGFDNLAAKAAFIYRLADKVRVSVPLAIQGVKNTPTVTAAVQT